jgi:hypothetical protein
MTRGAGAHGSTTIRRWPIGGDPALTDRRRSGVDWSTTIRR